MKIIIAGAGEVGFHLAKLLAFENQDLILIDENEEVLEHANSLLDVLTIKGDAASIKTLQEAEVHRARMFLAVTTSEKANLLAAMLAKKLGASQTIARIENEEYLNPDQREQFKELGIDHILSPPYLASLEIKRLIKSCSFTDVFEFEQGRVKAVGLTISSHSPLNGKRLNELDRSLDSSSVRSIAILRGSRTFIPSVDEMLYTGDHLYLVVKEAMLDEVTQYIGTISRDISKIMILGGSLIAEHVASHLEEDYHVTLIESEKRRCKELVERLDETLVVKGEPNNIDLLREEGLTQMDAFIALTPNTETNIITSLLAKECGIYKTIALVDNAVYTHISQNIGVDTIVNKKIIAANNIFRFVRKGRVEAITSLQGVDAELIEFLVHKDNQLTSKPLRKLKFPKEAKIACVVRDQEIFMPDEHFQLSKGDKVIVLCLFSGISKLERLFK